MAQLLDVTAQGLADPKACVGQQRQQRDAASAPVCCGGGQEAPQ